MVIKRTIQFCLVLAILWGVGFVAFTAHIGRTGAPAVGPRAADGIVVFTGLGGPRLASAMDLLDAEVAGRLLISGVHPDVTRESLAEIWDGDAALFDCCVDLDHRALTTIGNAEELERWVALHGYDEVILVTSDFHMPRALREARKRLPHTAITPYPIESGYLGDNGAPGSLSALRTLAIEYTKYLASWVF